MRAMRRIRNVLIVVYFEAIKSDVRESSPYSFLLATQERGCMICGRIPIGPGLQLLRLADSSDATHTHTQSHLRRHRISISLMARRVFINLKAFYRMSSPLPSCSSVYIRTTRRGEVSRIYVFPLVMRVCGMCFLSLCVCVGRSSSK
jgi:hypothetical protein